MLVALLPHVDKVRFANTGTEAAMAAPSTPMRPMSTSESTTVVVPLTMPAHAKPRPPSAPPEARMRPSATMPSATASASGSRRSLLGRAHGGGGADLLALSLVVIGGRKAEPATFAATGSGRESARAYALC